MPRRSNIPIHSQTITAVGGLDIAHLVYNDYVLHSTKLKEHRDEYYSLVLVLKGSGTLQCDMQSISIVPKSIVLVKPYQVHAQGNISKDAEAYYISIAPFLMPEFCRNCFEDVAVVSQCLKLSSADMKNLLKNTELLFDAFHRQNIYKTHIMHNFLNALVIRVASLFLASSQSRDRRHNQAFVITQQFKALISEHSFLHTASFFAERLHITTSHLNDCVKATTGLSVTQLLQQNMLLEAKRNLYYTNHNVKKISYDLGFEDHTYFSRLFKKLTKETPLTFRNKFRESSNHPHVL